MKKNESKPQSSTGEFVHDYTVMPYTYSYTTSEGNEEQYKKIPFVTSKQLAKRTERPRYVKMLTRDFIDDSLYNPSYGYFSKEVDIFSTNEPFQYNSIKDDEDFMYRWSKEFGEYRTNLANKAKVEIAEQTGVQENDEADKKQSQEPKSTAHVSRQIWHTPTELFKPYYGQALARYLLVNYQLNLYPYKDLIVYEMGGGNGTLMLNIMDYIRDTHPDVYQRTKYRIIEISSQLAEKQEHNLVSKAREAGHHDKVEIINKSIFEWNTVVPDPCFFIALEVFDNFAHDVIRYDNTTFQPFQGSVVIDGQGGFQEVYSPELDSRAKEFLKLRHELGNYVPSWELGYHPLSQPGYFRGLKNILWPFRGNLSDPEYIPTRYLEFLHILKDFFPNHHILTSDFTHLSDTIQGYNSPVVQTVLEQKMIPVKTYMALQGYFDILFPTDFDLAAELYKKVCGNLVRTASHGEFLETWADKTSTTTRGGDDPMLSFYQNAAFMYS